MLLPRPLFWSPLRGSAFFPWSGVQRRACRAHEALIRSAAEHCNRRADTSLLASQQASTSSEVAENSDEGASTGRSILNMSVWL